MEMVQIEAWVSMARDKLTLPPKAVRPSTKGVKDEF